MHISLALMHCRLFWNEMWKSAWKYCAESRIWGLVYSPLCPDLHSRIYMMEQVKPQHSFSRVTPVLVTYGDKVCWALDVILLSLVWPEWERVRETQWPSLNHTLKHLWTPSSISLEVYSYQNICKYIGLKLILTALDELKVSVH